MSRIQRVIILYLMAVLDICHSALESIGRCLVTTYVCIS